MQEKQAIVYLPTKADLERWKALSKAKGCSVSRFIYEMTERAIEERPITPKPEATSTDEKDLKISELIKEVEQLSKQNERLNEAYNSVSQTAIERVKKEIAGLFLGDITLDNQRIIKKLQLYTEEEKSQMVNKALRYLIDEGHIQETGKGLKWNTKR